MNLTLPGLNQMTCGALSLALYFDLRDRRKGGKGYSVTDAERAIKCPRAQIPDHLEWLRAQGFVMVIGGGRPRLTPNGTAALRILCGDWDFSQEIPWQMVTLTPGHAPVEILGRVPISGELTSSDLDDLTLNQYTASRMLVNWERAGLLEKAGTGIYPNPTPKIGARGHAVKDWRSYLRRPIYRVSPEVSPFLGQIIKKRGQSRKAEFSAATA